MQGKRAPSSDQAQFAEDQNGFFHILPQDLKQTGEILQPQIEFQTLILRLLDDTGSDGPPVAK